MQSECGEMKRQWHENVCFFFMNRMQKENYSVTCVHIKLLYWSGSFIDFYFNLIFFSFYWIVWTTEDSNQKSLTNPSNLKHYLMNKNMHKHDGFIIATFKVAQWWFTVLETESCFNITLLRESCCCKVQWNKEYRSPLTIISLHHLPIKQLLVWLLVISRDGKEE